jgi:ribonuclease VapC
MHSMFLDACAIISIITNEPSASEYKLALSHGDESYTSALAAFEAILVLSRPEKLNCTFLVAKEFVIDWLDAQNIKFQEPPSEREILAHAVAVAYDKGISRRSLNAFDCFHYAYAKALKMQLLTLDQKLRETDLVCLP